VNCGTGMCSSDRNAVRRCCYRPIGIWGWPDQPGANRPVHRNDGYPDRPPHFQPGCDNHNRRLNSAFREAMQAGNYRDYIGLANGGRFPYCATIAGRRRPSLRASAKGRSNHRSNCGPTETMLAKIEARYRNLGLISGDQCIHWVCRKRPETTCTCACSCSQFSAPREWQAYASFASQSSPSVNWLGNGVGQQIRQECLARSIAK